MATKKTDFVRVAVSGPTIDGRVIDPNMLVQAAKNYNPDTYAARGNIEHVRGVSGQQPFGMYADVLALKAEPITLNVAGKPDNQIALYAQLDVSDDLVKLNNNGTGQKLYTSIELLPDFAQTKEAYMVGLAFTDSPASLGTQRLQFTANAKAYGNLVSAPQEFELKLADPTPQQVASAGVGEALKELFKSWMTPPTAVTATAAPAAPAVAPAATAPASVDFSTFATQLQTTLEKMSAAIDATAQASATAATKLAADHAALVQRLESTPASGFTARPPATGGSGDTLADC